MPVIHRNRDADLVAVGGTSQTARDVAADLKVLSDLKKAADNVDAVDVETATNILKVLSRLYGLNSSGTWDRISALTGTTGGVNAIQLAVAALLHGKSGVNTTAPIPVKQPANGVSVDPYPLETASWPMLYNGSSYDQLHNNYSFTALAAAARTSSTNSADFTNYNARGLYWWVNVTAAPGGGETLTPKLYFKDPGSGTYILAYAESTPRTATGLYAYCHYPTALTVTPFNGGNTLVIPRTFRFHVEHSAAGTWNYGVTALLLL